MRTGLGSSADDLAWARAASAPEAGAGHEFAEAVIAAGGIRVLCTADVDGHSERSRLVGLDDHGNPLWTCEVRDIAGRALALSAGGELVVAGDVRHGPLEFQACVVRLAVDGRIAARERHGPQGPNGFAAVASLADGSVFAGGTTAGGGWVVILDAGLRITSDVPLPEVEELHALVGLDDGAVAVAATERRSTTDLGTAAVMVLDHDGRRRWHRTLPGSGKGKLTALAAVDGGLVAAGHTTETGPETRLWVVRLDVNGDVTWDRQLGVPREQWRGRALDTYPDGGLVVAGDRLRDNHRSLGVALLRPDGEVAWERDLDAAGEAVTSGVAITDDGGLVVAGSTRRVEAPGTRVRVVRLARDGRVGWDRVLDAAG